MKPTIIIVALLIAGCTEQAEKPPESQQYIYQIEDGWDTTQTPWDIDSNTIWIVPIADYVEAIDFAAWCQKAYPDVWREYYSTTTKGR